MRCVGASQRVCLSAGPSARLRSRAFQETNTRRSAVSLRPKRGCNKDSDALLRTVFRRLGPMRVAVAVLQGSVTVVVVVAAAVVVVVAVVLQGSAAVVAMVLGSGLVV
jgi:hypothetical protein